MLMLALLGRGYPLENSNAREHACIGSPALAAQPAVRAVAFAKHCLTSFLYSATSFRMTNGLTAYVQPRRRQAQFIETFCTRDQHESCARTNLFISQNGYGFSRYQGEGFEIVYGGMHFLT